MTLPRKEPRINVRFVSLQQMDHIELYANKRGYTLQNWIRMLIERELASDLRKKIQVRNGYKSLYTVLSILEEMADPKIVNFAKHKADTFAENFDMHQEYDLWNG